MNFPSSSRLFGRSVVSESRTDGTCLSLFPTVLYCLSALNSGLSASCVHGGFPSSTSSRQEEPPNPPPSPPTQQPRLNKTCRFAFKRRRKVAKVGENFLSQRPCRRRYSRYFRCIVGKPVYRRWFVMGGGASSPPQRSFRRRGRLRIREEASDEAKRQHSTFPDAGRTRIL